MRYAADQKETTRSRILEQGGLLMRRVGLSGASVERVMRAAGMTVGGFYGHFRSRDELQAELLRTAMRATRARLSEGLNGLTGERFLREVAERYLAPSHRDDHRGGCPIPATLSELGRKPTTRRVLASEIESLLSAISERAPGATAKDRRARAVRLLSVCIGGLTLARALGTGALSDEVLRVCRAAATS